jgi:hypothetical protein
MLVAKFMIIHHKLATYYPQGNGQVKLTNKTLGNILAKLVNVNRTDWDIMFFTTLWAYRTTYKMTTQFTPFELVFGTQPLMPVEFMIPIKRIRDVPIEDLNQAIHVRMKISSDWMKNIGMLVITSITYKGKLG